MNRRSAEKIFNSGKEPTISKLLEMDKSLRKLQCQVDSLSKNSTNSSKPPSSDIVKPRHHNQTVTTTDTAKRKIGGQPGHPLHKRPLFHTSEITSFFDYHLECCPNCSGQLQARPDQDRILQQVELNENPLKKNSIKPMPFGVRTVKKSTMLISLLLLSKQGFSKKI